MLPGIVNSDGRRGFEWEPPENKALEELQNAIAQRQEEHWQKQQWLEDNRQLMEDLEVDRNREMDALASLEEDIANLERQREEMLYG